MALLIIRPKRFDSRSRSMSAKVRSPLTPAVPPFRGARLAASFESPALEEGKDNEWLKPCLLNIEAVKLDHHGGEWM
jgi:hypothetical protein